MNIKKYKYFIFSIFIISCFLLNIGYSSFMTELNIKGDLVVTVPRTVFIDEVKINNFSEDFINDNRLEFNNNSIKDRICLNNNSFINYNGMIVNNSKEDIEISSFINLNESNYDISIKDINVGDKIYKGETQEFNIYIVNNNEYSCNDLSFLVDYKTFSE